jgi:hypothetical protein
MSNAVSAASYPVTLEVDFPDRKLSRASSFFRPIMIVPIAIILALITGPLWAGKGTAWPMVYAAGGVLFAPVLLMLLFRWKYPRWWFDWNVALTRFQLRVGAYFLLLTDTYPSTDEEQGVHAGIPYPDPAKDLKVGLPLVKWFLAIPHYFVLACLVVAVFVVTVIAWFAILFTGRYPKGMFAFVVGVMRWGLRVGAYAFLLVTDVYPPFSLE